MISERQKRIGLVLAGIFTLVGLAFLVFISYVVIQQGGEADISDRMMLPLSMVMLIGNLVSFFLIRSGRHLTGVWAVYILSILIFPVAATLVLQNVYLITGLTVVFFGTLFVLEAFPTSSRRHAIGATAIAILSILAIEIWNPAFRVTSDFNAPGFGAGILALAGVGFFAYFIPRLWEAISVRRSWPAFC